MIKYLFLLVFISSATSLAAPQMKRVEFVQSFAPKAQDTLELWIPTPLQDLSYQKLISRSITGNASVVKIASEGAHAAPYIYVRWDGVKNPRLDIVNIVEVSDRNGLLKEPADGDTYLKPTRHVQTDGIVKETADNITRGLIDPDAKARAIYEWIVAKTVRDPDVRGCGRGDVKSTLTADNLRGKCADLNSLFVGLARAAGIPAREVFGQRVSASAYSKALGKDGDNSKAQHCRAEFYSSRQGGWIPVDPADVRKFLLEENLKVGDVRAKQLADKFFGYWEGTWIAYNHARDFTLPSYQAETLNYFMYPLLAGAKFRPDGIDPQETGYSFATKLVDKDKS